MANIENRAAVILHQKWFLYIQFTQILVNDDEQIVPVVVPFLGVSYKFFF
jgi:hypothetical protein